jgi:hypothetical protein
VTRRALARAFGASAVALALAVPLLGARCEPAYSHCAQFISELGARGARCGELVSLTGFAPTGALVLAFSFAAAPLLPRSRAASAGLAGLACVGAGYLLSAVFPCDPGCPSTGSPSQAIHNLAGLVEYAGASFGLCALAIALRRAPEWRALSRAAAICAVAVAAGFGAMLEPSFAAERGLAQRIAEAGAFGWIALAVTLRSPLAPGTAVRRAPR